MAQFAANRKGYDPDQVDQFIASQTKQLQDAVARAASAESQLAQTSQNLAELQKRLDDLETTFLHTGQQPVVSDTQEEHLELPETASTIGEQVQHIISEAWESAKSIKAAAEEEMKERKAEAENKVAQLSAEAAKLQNTIEQAQNQADMKVAEAMRELESTLAAKREAQEVEFARKKADLDQLESNREQELKLRIEDRQAQAESEHRERMEAFAVQQREEQAKIAALNAEREHVLADLQKLQDALRQAVGKIDIPDFAAHASPSEPAPPAENSDAQRQSPKIAPMGASSVPFEESVDSGAGGGSGEVIMVPTIAGFVAVPVDSNPDSNITT